MVTQGNLRDLYAPLLFIVVIVAASQSRNMCEQFDHNVLFSC